MLTRIPMNTFIQMHLRTQQTIILQMCAADLICLANFETCSSLHDKQIQTILKTVAWKQLLGISLYALTVAKQMCFCVSQHVSHNGQTLISRHHLKCCFVSPNSFTAVNLIFNNQTIESSEKIEQVERAWVLQRPFCCTPAACMLSAQASQSSAG